MVRPPRRCRRRSRRTGRRPESLQRRTARSSGRSATVAARCRRGSTCRSNSAGSSSTISVRCRQRSKRGPAQFSDALPAMSAGRLHVWRGCGERPICFVAFLGRSLRRMRHTPRSRRSVGASHLERSPHPRASSMTARVAAIDLGTNTVRLLVAEVTPHAAGWRTVLAEQRVTRLGEGFRTTGELGDAAAARTAAAVIDYVARAQSAGATRVAIAATSAVRDASNGRVFVRDLEQATGIGVRIISGEEEACLTLAGIVAGLGRLPGVVVAFDIGGGSTEYILARDGALVTAVSLRLGVVPLAERFPLPNAVEPSRYTELRAAVQAQLVRELPPTLATRLDMLVGTAGTVTTLAALDLGLAEYDPARVQGHVLTRVAIERQRRRLNALDVAGRAALPCLEPGRADLIVGGVAIVEATLDQLGIEQLTVSDWSLREGLVAELAARQV